MKHRRLLIYLFTLFCAGLMACGGDASTEVPGEMSDGANGADDVPEGLEKTHDGNYVDQEGRTCDTATPCGDCDLDCRPAGNPFYPPAPGEPIQPGVNECSDLQVNLEEATPTVVLLIDQSGSMNQNFGGVNRLDATYGALMDPVDGLVSTLQDSIRFGMALYTSYDGGPTCPNIRDVRPLFNNYDAIKRVLEPASPQEDTPTGEAILGIMRMFEDDQVRGPKVILLATDGEPDTCAEPDPQNGHEESIQAAQQAHARGVETVVLSVGNEISERHLQDMANAGAGLAPGDSTQIPFYRADDPDSLKQHMAQIISGSRNCIFQVDGGILDPALANRATIRVNGAEVPFAGSDGWVLHQNEQVCFGARQCIELRGNACENIQHGNVDIEGDFVCVYDDPEGKNGYGDPTTGDDPDGGDGTDDPGPGDGVCIPAGGECEYDGDCCSGLCGESGARSACVLN